MNVQTSPPIVKCLKHDRSCCIKTGTNPKSVDTYKRSFYMCSEKPPCDFKRLNKDLKALNCNKHPNEVVSKQIFVRVSPKEMRNYFVCNLGYKETGKFCGHNLITMQQGPHHFGDEKADETENKATIGPQKLSATEKSCETGHSSSTSSLVSLKIQRLEQELLKKKKLVAALNLSALPDGGIRMKEHIVELELEISKLASGEKKLQLKAPVQLPILPPKLIPIDNIRSEAVSNAQHARAVFEKAIFELQHSMKSKPKEDEEENDPEDILIPLVQHQRRALSWLLWRERQHPSGGILADDMGLGKTLVMIALVLKTRKMSDKKENEATEWLSKDSKRKLLKSSATLVICPASLLFHWEAEVNLRCQSNAITVHLYFGTKSKRNNISVENLAEYDMIVTTYDTVRCELASASGKSLLERIEFRRIILDEGHVIKNPSSQTSLAVCNLSSASRWVVTGTPIHNSLTDIYSLLRFLRCSPFDDSKLWKSWVHSTSIGNQRLSTIVSCLLLRRTKTETDSNGKPLVSLPSKTIHCVELELSKEENEIYCNLFIQSKEMMRQYLMDRGEILKHSPKSSAAYSDSGSSVGQKLDNVNMVFHIFVRLLRMRQCCCHPNLLRGVVDVKCVKNAQSGDDLLDDIVSQMQGLQLTNPDPISDDFVGKDGKFSPVYDVEYHSTKITALLARLNEKGQNHTSKSVVVSQWTSMLSIVAFHLKRARIPFCEISGNVAIKDRMSIVDSFNRPNSDPQVMLLSLKAGGVGLNLIGGSNLFIMDVHWNPALECQAIDRIHRMGQTRDVNVFRFICKDTIETKIAALQEKKLLLAKSVVEKGKGISSTTVDQLRALFGF